MRDLNPHVAIEPIDSMFTGEDTDEAVARYDLVLDGTDNFETRFAVNAACVAAGKPLVSGAIGRWTGQVGVFAGRPCYRCLVDAVPPDEETCAAVGVVGALAGRRRLDDGAGGDQADRRRWRAADRRGCWIYDALAALSRTVRITADPRCPVCG